MDMAVWGRLFLYEHCFMAQRVTFYIDGFNFYYGLRRTKRNEPQWGDYYWIDIVKLCRSFLGEGQERPKGQLDSPLQQACLDVQERASFPWCYYARCCNRRNETLRSTWKVETSKHRKVCVNRKTIYHQCCRATNGWCVMEEGYVLLFIVATAFGDCWLKTSSVTKGYGSASEAI